MIFISCFSAIGLLIASHFKCPSQIMMAFWTPSRNEELTQPLFNQKEKQLLFIYLVELFYLSYGKLYLGVIFFSFMHPPLGVSLQSFLFLIWDKVPERCSRRGPCPRTFGGSSRRPPGAWWCSVPPMRRGRCRWSPSAPQSQAPRPKQSTIIVDQKPWANSWLFLLQSVCFNVSSHSCVLCVLLIINFICKDMWTFLNQTEF